MLVQGFLDGMEDDVQIDAKKYASHIRTLFRERMQKKAQAMEEKGTEYVETFVANEGGSKTESGIGYKILKGGGRAKNLNLPTGSRCIIMAL